MKIILKFTELSFDNFFPPKIERVNYFCLLAILKSIGAILKCKRNYFGAPQPRAGKFIFGHWAPQPRAIDFYNRAIDFPYRAGAGADTCAAGADTCAHILGHLNLVLGNLLLGIYF